MTEVVSGLNEVEFMAEVSRIILHEKILPDCLHKIMKLMTQDLKLLRCMLTIYNRKTGKIYIRDACGVSSQERERGIYSPGEGITGRVVESGESIIVPDINNDPRFLNRTGVQVDSSIHQSFICVPIKTGADIIGALSCVVFYSDDNSLENMERLMGIIGSIIFHAVQHSQALEEEMQLLKDENNRLHDRLHDKNYSSRLLLGKSSAILWLHKMIEKVASTDATVLILGESGVGKSLVAQEIHNRSLRKELPFVKLNCAALPETIIESELFGHERGAFTGAESRRIGRFEQADKGTIFLDEIGEISINVQAKLLRILQEKEFERVGGSQTLRSDVRIIAATNRDLEEKVREGSFREDLYYRLNIIPLVVPPLRKRKSDIILLADFFIEKYTKINNKQVNRMTTPAIDMLVSYHWPGNVRELENAIERAVILSDDNAIHAYHLPPSLQKENVRERDTGAEGTLQQRLDAIEYEMIVDSLKATNGNMSKAAEMLGLTNRMIGLRAKKYNIEFKNFRSHSEAID